MEPRDPLFSVIVPTYNRPQRLGACLHALARLAYPRERYEVIVVDDGSETPPRTVAAAYQDQLAVRFIENPHQGPAATRNTGAEHAAGRFLAFTDDDCAPATDWLETLAGRFAPDPDRAIGGRVLNALPQNPYAAASQLLVGYLYTYYNADPERARFLTSNNLALPAERFREVGGFDATIPWPAAEDREFCDRWLHCGLRITYAPEVLIYHAHDLSLREFCGQHLRYGQGAFHYWRARARRGGGGLTVEPLRFYLDLVRHPLRDGKERAVRSTLLLLLAQVANAAGFLVERARAQKRHAPVR